MLVFCNFCMKIILNSSFQSLLSHQLHSKRRLSTSAVENLDCISATMENCEERTVHIFKNKNHNTVCSAIVIAAVSCRLACQSSGCLPRVSSTASTPLRVTCGPTASCFGKSSLWVTFPGRAVLLCLLQNVWVNIIIHLSWLRPY